ncbi:MAG: phosphatase PAP2 family protein [Ilumatobacter sp.]|uniref:phosphatase PAP2 family protein n=1 Tax=Ilumatobacter sp. TaxID=1967498 RepID=UPI00262DA44E|nr:phosphatase PAP2 family protein [Ilumatobacter sp.]MDJ0768310.1 phosphatase PAP2 family protein [Ilumatobacter sp.]
MRSRQAVIWGASLVLLVALTVVVMVADGALPGEVAIIEWFQQFGQPVPAFGSAVRAVTGTEANIVVGIAPAAWLIHRHGRRGVAAVVICLVAMLVVQPVAKEIVDRDRPSETQVDVRGEHTSRSYPSGHALGTTVVWGTAAGYADRSGRRRRAVGCLVPIPCTATASAIQGVHWLSDAVAGAIIGAMAAALALRVVAGDRVGDRIGR